MSDLELRSADFRHPDFQLLVAELDKEFWVRYPDEQQNFEPFNRVDENARVVVAYHEGHPVGCGCYRPVKGEDSSIEIKRMYVTPRHRSKGLGKRILFELEQRAVHEGFTIALLETGVKQPEAVAAYTQSGYERIPNYPPYVGVELSICMRKILTPSHPSV